MMSEMFDFEDGPKYGRERIMWWRETKRERAAKIAAIPSYRRNQYLNMLHNEKALIRNSYNTFSLYHCGNWHISYEVMNRAAERRRQSGLSTPDDRKRHRHTIASFRVSRLIDGGPMARMDAMTEGNRPFIFDRHSGFIMQEDQLMNAMNAGIQFEMLTFTMQEGKAIRIYEAESYKKHFGFWSFDVHEKDRNIKFGEPVRCQFYFSHPTDLMWFKFRYG